MGDNTHIFLVKIIGKLLNFLVREIGKCCLPYKRNIFIFLIYIAGVHIHTKYMYPCLVVLPNARRASDRFVHCVLGVKWGGGHVAAPFVPMVVALVLNFLCTQYYSLREGG